jgi:hypothetical protein
MDSIIHALAGVYFDDPPQGGFLTLIGQAYSYFLQSLDIGNIMRHAAVYANDESDDCLLCDCQEMELCTLWNFVSSPYSFDIISGVYVAGSGYKTGTNEFANAIITLTFTVPITITRVIAQWSLQSSTPGTTIWVTTPQGAFINFEGDPGTGTQTRMRLLTVENVTSISMGVDGFLNPILKRLQIEYISGTTLDGEACTPL